jgi:5'-deoxynucleotidase YfbR-like HD superfamily hydrolase
MHIRKITYTDYDGNERTEEFHFNLNKAECYQMAISSAGGMEKRVRSLIKAENSAEIFKIFKAIILDSFGVKSDDGKRFIKSQELRDAFEQTEAYSNLLIELATDADKAADFINKVLPTPTPEQMTEYEQKMKELGIKLPVNTENNSGPKLVSDDHQKDTTT